MGGPCEQIIPRAGVIAMAERQASVLVSDEIYFNLYGKVILQGIYQTDLGIAADPSQIPQLVFFFSIETDPNDPFHSLAVEVTIPGGQAIRTSVGIFPPEIAAAAMAASPGRARLIYRQPLLVPGPTLRPGKIDAKVIHEKGEIAVSAPWIVLNKQKPKAN
jgi:hypothetical protein